MGILNLTPDSFYDGGEIKSDAEAFNKVEKMLAEGATFIDVGGYSSRPGAENVAEEIELQRIIPVIEGLLKRFPELLVSVDTFRSQVAREAIEAGAALINDISAGKLDNKMIPIVGKLKVPYIVMHMRGNPANMQSQTKYENVVKDLIFYFSERIDVCHHHNISDIIIDPGFGFAKTLTQNYSVLNKLELFRILEKPILVGVSRKSMAYKPLGLSADNALNATTVLHTIALEKHIQILRVHDVAEAMECIKLCEMLDQG